MKIGRPLLAFLLIAALVAADIVWTRITVARIERENPPRGTFVALDGGRIHINRRDPAGVAKGNVVLLHGASGNSLDVLEALGEKLSATGFRVFAPDRPGHGYSDRWPDAASPARQAQLLRVALAQIGVDHAIVLGHSLAGAVAVNFALDHGDFTDGLVLVSPVTHPWPGGITWYYNVASFGFLGAAFASAVALPAGLAIIDKAVASVFTPQTPPPDYVQRTGATLVLRPEEFIANAQDVAGLKTFVTEQSPRETGLRLPVAIIAGDATDTIVSTKIHSVASAAAIPGATLTVLPGVGHAPHWVDPQAVVDAVEAVFSRKGAAAKAAAK